MADRILIIIIHNKSNAFFENRNKASYYDGE